MNMNLLNICLILPLFFVLILILIDDDNQFIKIVSLYGFFLNIHLPLPVLLILL